LYNIECTVTIFYFFRYQITDDMLSLNWWIQSNQQFIDGCIQSILVKCHQWKQSSVNACLLNILSICTNFLRLKGNDVSPPHWHFFLSQNVVSSTPCLSRIWTRNGLEQKLKMSLLFSDLLVHPCKNDKNGKNFIMNPWTKHKNLCTFRIHVLIYW
jgi:hypothetical protein